MNAVGKQGIMPDLSSRKNPLHFSTALSILMKAGVDIHRINLIAEGKYENYRGEVHYQEPAAGSVITDNTKIILRIGSTSAVDFMPYQFFYGMGGNVSR